MFELMFFLAVGRYVAIARKPLHCAIAFTVVILIVQVMQYGLLAGLAYALLVLPITAGTYVLLDRFEDQLVQWFAVAALGGVLVTFGPSAALAKLQRPKAQAYVHPAFTVTYPPGWTVEERGKYVYLHGEHGQATALVSIHLDGQPSQPQGRPTTKLGGKEGVIPDDPNPVQGAALHHRYVYALPNDTLHVDAMVDTNDPALIEEEHAIEASWKWKR
jgi:hypothetical protein